MAGRPIKKRTCAQPVVGRAMPENEIPPVYAGGYLLRPFTIITIILIVSYTNLDNLEVHAILVLILY